MISMLDAIPLANDYVAAKYLDYGLVLASRVPVRLPTGWRFPYDSFAGSFRVRHSMLILFVADDGTISEEWNDFLTEPHQDALHTLYNELAATPPPNLPPLQTILPRVMESHPGAYLESIETVWAINEAGNPDLYWRLGLIEGIYRYVVVVGRDETATLDRTRARVPYLQKTLRSLSAVPKWDLGRARFRRQSGNFTVNIGDLLNVGPGREHLRSQWTVWCCVAQAAEFVEDLGYGEFGPHNVRIEYLASDASVDGAAFDTVRGAPTISFLRGGGWAEALSIVLHELGHALWSLLYTRAPAVLDVVAHANELEGIQEGFCDYFAATLLSKNNGAVVIGGELAAATASRYHLPRLVDGHPFTDAALADMTSADAHLIGHKWANFLFNVRLAVQQRGGTARVADDLILRAHTKPLLPPSGGNPVTPMRCYLTSLQETAVSLNLPFIDQNFWQDLIVRHQI
ncbi:MAG: M36 family metallopeptidase [Ardenticatenaceae bacterium]|nr:M36 family metallopeptidase [Ardenticatenaceae bacterium]